MDVRKSIIGVALILSLAGCTGNQVRVEYVDRPVEVLVPVPAEIPEPTIIKEPFLPIWLLTEENINDPDLIAKYYVKTVKLLQTYSNLLQCQVDAYRTESEPQCKEN